MTDQKTQDALSASRLSAGLERKYIPKGGMCATCIWVNANCSHMEFETMPAIGTTAKGEIIVRCTAHLRSNDQDHLMTDSEADGQSGAS